MTGEREARLNPDLVRRAVLAALEEDGAWDDVTTALTVPPDQRGRGVLLAKAAGVVAGLPVGEAAFKAVDPAVRFLPAVDDGSSVVADTVLATLEGPLASLLRAERVALNFVQRLSGVATLTARAVAALEGSGTRLLDTRKTTPGLRALERYAVRAGGGHNHRFNLADGILIKDNHIAAARARGLSLAELVAQTRAAAPHLMRVEVEVTSLDEAREALDAGAEVLLLDNMPPEEMRRVVKLARGRAVTEASGGVTLERLPEIAAAGVQYVSMGALTHSAPALDISLELALA
ncbi:MAG TPA: carboxylating nicotinate-nucleotide diphosphorylase [Dehalococcoidia bacterium]